MATFISNKISENLFGEVVKKRGGMNWALVMPLFWAPMLPLTRIATTNVPGNLRLKIYLGTAGVGKNFFHILTARESRIVWTSYSKYLLQFLRMEFT